MTTNERLETLDAMRTKEFGTLPDLLRLHARLAPRKTALIQDAGQIEYAALDRLVDRAAAALQRDGIRPGDVVAICALNSIRYAVAFIAALRAGAAVAPLAPLTTPEALGLMLDNCDAKILLADGAGNGVAAAGQAARPLEAVGLDEATPFPAFDQWLAPQGTAPAPVPADPDAVFNIIYSSGTTGTPKGIVHTNRLRWPQICGGTLSAYQPDSVTIVSTPLYSNTTLVSFLPALGGGGTVVLMKKFDPAGFLALAEKHRATNAMLVPVQYRRLMEHPGFDRHDLSSFRIKFSTSAPFSASLKAEVLRRWPGGLVEYYGMTEGGGSCMLLAHEHPDKLGSVGRPMDGHDIRIIDEDGVELPAGSIGEIVGHSPFMMTGYNKEPEKSAATIWTDPAGKRFIRTGDIGRFDEDGFLTIMDRAKDTIISGGFNIYPSDIEAVLAQHEAVAEAAVVGVPSDRWGETPIAVIVPNEGFTAVTADEIREWANARLGKTQRIAAAWLASALPRNDIGKVSKRHLRDEYARRAQQVEEAAGPAGAR
ncbi:MAG: acyl--CoA ligase [Burkholderiaceae bacterium]|jgi:acyl-CoA synthetase (AMP-forming)/AMP-acid ligase II|nr:acyl--CoA ligase [Burkholderiaceae bacterium]MEB2318468.1 class I adenylate-forming enzyme family protein [Pseudomonadota bacterium]